MTKPIIVFLDIDGVVATHRSLFSFLSDFYGVDYRNEDCTLIDDAIAKHKHLEYPWVSMSHWPFCKTSIKNLHRLQREEKVKFVISSTWRLGKSIEDLRDLFGLKGLSISIIDKTSEKHDMKRGEQIALWLSENKVKKYIIIDDECQYDIIQTHPNNCIETNFYTGFDDEKYDEAVKLLKSLK